MRDDWEKRKAALLGKAKAAFDQAKAEAKSMEKPPPAAGRSSEMVKQTQPVLTPKPPGLQGAVISRQQHRSNMAKDDKAARQGQERTSGISHKHVIHSNVEQRSKEAVKLREKFRQAARKDQEMER